MTKTEKMAKLSVFTALSLVLSFVETLIPAPMPLPGLKIGLSNAGILVSMSVFGFKEGLIVGVIKSLMSGLFFGRVSAILYSLPATIASALVMGVGIFVVNGKKRLLSEVGVSVMGSCAFNAVQLKIASVLVSDKSIFSILPYFQLLSVFTGVFIGAASGFLINRVKKEEL